MFNKIIDLFIRIGVPVLFVLMWDKNLAVGFTCIVFYFLILTTGDMIAKIMILLSMLCQIPMIPKEKKDE